MLESYLHSAHRLEYVGLNEWSLEPAQQVVKFKNGSEKWLRHVQTLDPLRMTYSYTVVGTTMNRFLPTHYALSRDMVSHFGQTNVH